MIRLWKGYHSYSLISLVRESWEGGHLLILCPPFLKDLSFISFLPREPVEFIGDWNLDEETKKFWNQSSANFSPRVEYPARPVLGVFTSGTSTGIPRLILYSHKNIKSSLDSISKLFDLNRIQAIFCYPQPFHTFGLLLGYVLSFQYGFNLFIEEGRYTSQFHERWFSTHTDGLLTLGTPTHFHDLIQFIKKQGLKVNSSYSCIIGGAPVTRALWRATKEVLKIEAPSIGYGATEASPGIAHHRPGHEPKEDGEIGYPLKHLFINRESERGLEFSGPSACLAVIHNGEIEFPEKILIQDKIKERSDGVWVYQGRLELTLNRGGEKLSLERIEGLLKTHLNLDALGVVAPDERLGEDLGLLVKPSSISKQEIQRGLKQWTGIQFALSFFTVIAEFPVNSSSKIDRKTATERVLNGYTETSQSSVSNFNTGFTGMGTPPPTHGVD